MIIEHTYNQVIYTLKSIFIILSVNENLRSPQQQVALQTNPFKRLKISLKTSWKLDEGLSCHQHALKTCTKVANWTTPSLYLRFSINTTLKHLKPEANAKIFKIVKYLTSISTCVLLLVSPTAILYALQIYLELHHKTRKHFITHASHSQ